MSLSCSGLMHQGLPAPPPSLPPFPRRLPPQQPFCHHHLACLNSILVPSLGQSSCPHWGGDIAAVVGRGRLGGRGVGWGRFGCRMDFQAVGSAISVPGTLGGQLLTTCVRVPDCFSILSPTAAEPRAVHHHLHRQWPRLPLLGPQRLIPMILPSVPSSLHTWHGRRTRRPGGGGPVCSL